MFLAIYFSCMQEKELIGEGKAEMNGHLLEGERIIIRKAKMSDLDSIFLNIYSDEVLLETMFLEITKNREEAEARLMRAIEFQKDKPLFFVALKETDEVIGLCGIREETERVYSEAGICIARRYQRQGYASEVLAILLNYAFAACNAKAFAYYCMSCNNASKALAKKFGFLYDGVNKETRRRDNQVFDIERYVLLRTDYIEENA